MKSESTITTIRAALRCGCRAPQRFFSSLIVLVMAMLSYKASAQLTVGIMPSYSQNQTYANAAINESIQVWGRVSGGSGSYTGYTLDFGDGSSSTYAVPPPPVGVTSITFQMLDTCSSGTYTFYLNGVLIGSTAANPTNNCTCTPPLTSFTVNNAALLANWVPNSATNALRIDVAGSHYISWARANITASGGGVTTAYLVNGVNGAAFNGNMNLCTAGYGTRPGSYTNNSLFSGSFDTEFIKVDHTYTTGGSKTVTLSVTDSAGNTASRSAVIRVLVSPTHDERVNMAIEKGLIYLYRNQQKYTAGGGTPVSFWYQNSGEYGNATTGAAIQCFAENGHLANNNPATDIYAATVKRGALHLVTRGYNIAIGAQPDGNPDSNGNGRGIYEDSAQSYSQGFTMMGITNAFKDAADAAATPIPAGLWVGGGITPANFKVLIEDYLDCLSWSQGDSGFKGWHYPVNTASSGNGGFDGSTHQWPIIAILTAKERWGINPPGWVVANAVSAFQQGTDQTVNGVYEGGTGYSSNTSWRTTGKTGGALVGWYLGGKLVGSDTDANRSIKFLQKYWGNQGSYGGDGAGWAGDLYAMFGIKKGLALQGVSTITTADNVVHDWYKEMSGWLLGNASLVPPAYTGQNGRTIGQDFGQNADGSWTSNVGFVTSQPITTAFGILILTKAVTIPLPVAVILPVGDQSSRFPAAFTLDGSTSYHQDSGIPLVEYLWDLDASNGVNFVTPDASGPTPTVNPGWNTNGPRTVTLRVKDNQNPALTATTTIVINVTANDVAPTALPMPPSQVPQIYTGTLGSTIVLDGSASFDVDGDTIESYSWDLNGDGLYGTAADIALDTSGNNASANTASVIYTNPNNSQVGLKVCSTPRNAQGVAIGPQKCGVSARPVDVYASATDLYVSAITITDLVPTVRADVSAILTSAAGSSATTNVIVRFYNGNPLAGGVQIGGSYTVNIPAGGSVVLPTIDNLVLGGATTLWAFVDANNLVVEYNEINNTANTSVSNRPPVAVAQDVTVNADGNCQGTVTAAQVNNGSSDPDGNPLTFTLAPAGPFSLGSTPVTLSVSDGFITTTATANVIVLDVTPPALAGQGAGSIVECPAVPTFTAPTATDNCDANPVVSEVGDVTTPGNCAGSYSRTKTWKAIDASGNESATVSQTIVVADTTAPTIGAAGAGATIECPAEPVFTAPTATDNCDTAPSVEEVGDVSIPGTCPGSYTRTKTWKAKDCTGNESGTVSQTIIVSDTTDPTLAGQGADGTIECPAVPVFTAPGASDACDPNPTVTEVGDVTTPGGCAGSYTRTKTWVATDCGGNRSVAVSQTITVTDTTSPAIAGQGADATIESPAVPVFTAPGATDNCDAQPTVSVVSDVTAPGACDGAYSRTVTWKATDCSGHESVTVSQTITVSDTTAPTLAGQGADATIECPTAPVFTAPRAQDANDATPVVTEVSDVTTPGNCAGTYSRTKTWTAKDCTGNESAAVSQTITVVDTMAPTLAGQGANATIECPAVPAFTAPGATDACDAAPTVTEVSDVTTPGNCPGSYTRTKTWTATDCTGNVSVSASQSITVTDTTSPTISAAGASATIECPAEPVFTAPTAADACDANPVVTEISDVTIPGSCPGSYVRTKTWVANDCSGHQSGTVSQTITAVDTTAPAITSPAAITVVNDPGVCGARVIYDVPVGSDNCSAVNTVQTAGLPSRAIFPVGQTVNTFVVTDCSGLTATCSFTVTVNDTQKPTIVCPANKLVVSDSGSCNATAVVLGTPAITDNCPGAIITNNHASTTYPVGVTTVVWTVTDASGNTATCNQTVTVLSSISPTMSGFLPPLAGQPVGNKINRGQVVPHKLKLAGCSGQTISSGVTVYLKVQGIDSATGNVFQDVVEDAQGVGTDGVGTSDGIMRLTGGQYHFNLDTGNFSDPNTLAGSRYYKSTVTVVDNATLMVLGTISINLETAAR